MHTLGVVHRASVGLRYNYDRTAFGLADSALDVGGQLVDIGKLLGDDGGLGSGGNCAVHGQETGIAPHYLYKEYAVMRVCGIVNLIHALHDGVERGVITDGVIGSVQVVVDSAGQSYYRDVVFGRQLLCAGQRSVTTYYYKGVNFVLLYGLVRLSAALNRKESLAA